MGKQFCLEVASHNNKYSSPIPVIGFYIAACTLVCLLFMISDVIHGFRHRKLWIPCRFFSLNSLTLTLLAIASKLPVDLTTSMPSAQDQLSKLSGSVFICVSMSFSSISMVTQRESERLSNMISLTIFVVTVVVNICIQMVTGVIFSFIIEHVIIMSCMLLLLAMMWYILEFEIPWSTSHTHSPIVELKKIIHLNSENKSTMMQKLKSAYVSRNIHSPEFEFLDSSNCLSICMISTLCALVLLQAALRSIFLKEVKFRCGVSDYKWSIWMVVVTQILTVLVGGITVVYRWFFSMKVLTEEITKETNVGASSPCSVLSSLSKVHTISLFKTLIKGFVFIFQAIKGSVITVLTTVAVFLAILGSLLSIIFCIPKMCFDVLRNVENTTYLKKEEWIERNCEENIKRCIEKGKRDCSTHLAQLLSKTPQSAESQISKILIASNKKVSCLLVVVFVRMVTVALPNIRSASLIHSLDEAFEIIYFIDKKMNANKRRCAVAKELWMNRENNCHWFHRKFIRPFVVKFYAREFMDVGSHSQPQLDLHSAVKIIEELKQARDKIPCYFFEEDELVDVEINNVYELIIGKESKWREFTSIDELYDHMEQLLVDMLHLFLSQLPISIFKHLDESSSTQQYEERTRYAIKFLCKVEQLEDKVHWAFPDDITSLTTSQVPPMDTQHIETVDESNIADANVSGPVVEDNEIQELV